MSRNDQRTLDDRRTPQERSQTILYAVATDSFLSGWGNAPLRSLYAVACPTYPIVLDILARMRRRTDFQRVRLNLYPPTVRPGDHLAIVWYTEFTYHPGV